MTQWQIVGLVLMAGALCACGEPATPAEEAATATLPGGAAIEAVAGDRFFMDGETGREEVRLAGIVAPRAEPSASLAREALDALLAGAGARLVLEPAGPGRNRHGTLIAEVSGPSGSFQDSLVAAGWAMVDSHGDHAGPTPGRLALEAQARDAGLGAWAHHDLEVRRPDPNGLAAYLDSVQIVEGRVISTGSARDGRIYLNFGTDWRTDFTVQVLRRNQSGFEDAGIDLRGLEGAVVRVRGWLYDENGPMITLDHREALELVDAPEPAPLPGRR